MKRVLAVAVLGLPFLLCACEASYDSFRSRERHGYTGDYESSGSEGSYDQNRSHARARPGWSVTESRDVQGGYGPGSYGGHSSTYIRPDDDGDVIIDSESHRR